MGWEHRSSSPIRGRCRCLFGCRSPLAHLGLFADPTKTCSALRRATFVPVRDLLILSVFLPPSRFFLFPTRLGGILLELEGSGGRVEQDVDCVASALRLRSASAFDQLGRHLRHLRRLARLLSRVLFHLRLNGALHTRLQEGTQSDRWHGRLRKW